MAPLHLNYYGLCMLNDNYEVKLHFAKIAFSNDQSYSSLGKHVFDVSIEAVIGIAVLYATFYVWLEVDSPGSMKVAYKGYRCIAGEEDKSVKTSRQLRKQAARRPSNSSFNEDVEDNNDLDPSYNSNGAELQENDDAYEVDYPSRKRKVSNSSQKKHVAKNGKTSQKPKKANDDLEKSEEPPKKFSHST
ncbi:putative LRR receptor-like serine/threonine-protein kinase [Glycine max]|nr:putative LRR receptor-like serine/threonine-protein kinase [Glycine max]